MTKLICLTKRNLKEIIRDPLSLIFCLCLPVFMLVLMQIIFQNMSNVPNNFSIENYAFGICIFGYTFTMMFVAMLIAQDKNTAFANRIAIAPISKFSYIFGYFLSAFPIVLGQTFLFLVISLCFGMPFDINFLLAFLYLIPSACLYILLGIFIGTICKNEKQTGPISSIIITLVGIFGGVFMPLDQIGGGLYTIINILPFSHSVEIASNLFTIGADCIYPHILWLLGYSLLIIVLTYLLLRIQNKN